MVNSSPAENTWHVNTPVIVPPGLKILPSPSSYFDGWLFHNTSISIYSTLHFPRCFCYSLPLLRCTFIRLIHVQIVYSYRPKLGPPHSISGFLMLLKYVKYTTIWHIHSAMQYFHTPSSNTFRVSVLVPFLSWHMGVFRVGSVWAALLPRIPLANCSLATPSKITSSI